MFHYSFPARGRKLPHVGCRDVLIASFITNSPQGDGNKKFSLHEKNCLLVSSLIPRKGTETACTVRGINVTRYDSFSTHSPQGDGNPQRDLQGMVQGGCFITHSPQGDGNKLSGQSRRFGIARVSLPIPHKGTETFHRDRLGNARRTKFHNQFPARGRKHVEGMYFLFLRINCFIINSPQGDGNMSKECISSSCASTVS